MPAARAAGSVPAIYVDGIAVVAQGATKATVVSRSGLRLDLRVAALEGGDNGKVFIPGKSAESKLVHALAGLGEQGIMPPKEKPFTPAEIGKVRAWIDAGAVWPDDGKVAVKKSDHWAYQPVRRPNVPSVQYSVFSGQSTQPRPNAKLKTENWSLNTSPSSHPIDAFIRASLAHRVPQAGDDVLARLAETIAAHYATNHTTRVVAGESFTAERDAMLAAMDQPTIDGVNTYFVAREAAAAGNSPSAA